MTPDPITETQRLRNENTELAAALENALRNLGRLRAERDLLAEQLAAGPMGRIRELTRRLEALELKHTNQPKEANHL